MEPEDKQLQEARLTVRWSPVLLTVALTFLTVQGIGFGKHPGMGQALHLVSPVGMTLYVLSNWQRARCTLAGRSPLGGMILSMLGLVITTSGPTLVSTYRRGDTFLLAFFGGGVLVLAAFCVTVFVRVLVQGRRAARREAETRPVEDMCSRAGGPADPV